MTDHKDLMDGPSAIDIYRRTIGNKQPVPLPTAGQSPATVAAIRSDERNAFGRTVTRDLTPAQQAQYVARETAGVVLPPTPKEYTNPVALQYLQDKARKQAAQMPDGNTPLKTPADVAAALTKVSGQEWHVGPNGKVSRV